MISGEKINFICTTRSLSFHQEYY